MEKAHNDLKLKIILFLSGAIVMILELTGARLVAPYIGSSVFVWTSLIGVILACLSIGYYIGGKLADGGASLRGLATILLVACLGIALLMLLYPPVLTFTRSSTLDLRLKAIISTIILFALPSTALGCVSPYIIRLRLDELKHSGEVVGTYYAISTVGSIFGTFVAGFFLFAYVGTLNIINGLCLMMLLLSLYAYLPATKIGKYSLHIIALSFVSLSYISGGSIGGPFLQDRLVADIDTMYRRYWILDTEDRDSGKVVRALVDEPFGMQAAIFRDHPDQVYNPYLPYFRLTNHFHPDPKRALLIGGGAFTLPKDFLARNPQSSIDVVEIDSELLQIAQDYFFFRPDSRINLIFEDGRTFINRAEKRYDAIFIDVFGSSLMPPFHLTTIEFARALKSSLLPGGLVAINLVSGVEGEAARFLNATVRTYAEEFPQVYAFRVHPERDTSLFQNLILIALNRGDKAPLESTNAEYSAMLKNIWNAAEASRSASLLTDDFAPVESFLNVSRYHKHSLN